MASSTKAGAGAGTAARVELSIERLLSRNVLIVAALLAASVALAWSWLISSAMPAGAMDGMGAMSVEPWTFGYLGPAFAMWALMMVAMMLPSAAPMILLHARIDRVPTPAKRLRNTLLFALAYLTVWSGFSALAAIAQAVLVDLGLVSAMTLAIGSRPLTAALLLVAALYQLTPAKRACLDQCRSPVHFVMRYWSPGVAGAMRLGIVHGLYCIGCCWGLMLLLFAGGVMNLAWIAALALMVFIEKLTPPALRVDRILAAALFAGALLLLVK